VNLLCKGGQQEQIIDASVSGKTGFEGTYPPNLKQKYRATL